MIPVPGAVKVTYHQAFAIEVGAEGDQVAIVLTDQTGEANVYMMSKGNAETVEQGLVKARTGVHIERVNGNGQP